MRGDEQNLRISPNLGLSPAAPERSNDLVKAPDSGVGLHVDLRLDPISHCGGRRVSFFLKVLEGGPVAAGFSTRP